MKINGRQAKGRQPRIITAVHYFHRLTVYPEQSATDSVLFPLPEVGIGAGYKKV
jgi:hypothetical protein